MAEVVRDTVIPLYMQIAEDIKSKIERKELEANARIPTELELSEAYGVSRITIRKALELLVEDEILVRRQRIGTFVSDKKVSRSLNSFMGFSQSCELSGAGRVRSFYRRNWSRQRHPMSRRSVFLRRIRLSVSAGSAIATIFR